MDYLWSLVTSDTFWTAVGSLASAAVLFLSIKQIIDQNKRQNLLDERQKNIDKRERYARETAQATKIFTEYQFDEGIVKLSSNPLSPPDSNLLYDCNAVQQVQLSHI